jgi:hypothetical protein
MKLMIATALTLLSLSSFAKKIEVEEMTLGEIYSSGLMLRATIVTGNGLMVYANQDNVSAGKNCSIGMTETSEKNRLLPLDRTFDLSSPAEDLENSMVILSPNDKTIKGVKIEAESDTTLEDIAKRCSLSFEVVPNDTLEQASQNSSKFDLSV